MKQTARVILDLEHLTIGHVKGVLAILREIAQADLIFRDGVPTTVQLDFELDSEGGGVARDLWDLRDVCDQLCARLSPYFVRGPLLRKPEIVNDDSEEP